MDIVIAIISAVGGYLLGAISFSRIFGKILVPDTNIVDVERKLEGTDINFRARGVGASALGNATSDKAGCLAGALDILKVFVPTLVLRLIFPDQPYYLIAASLGMVGHNWPIYYRFKGGHGYSTAYGGALAVDWLGALLSTVFGFVFGLFILKSFSLLFLASMFFFIPWFIFTKGDFWHIAYAVVINVSFILAAVPEIKQVSANKEKMPEDRTMRQTMMDIPMGRGLVRMADKMNWKIFD
jgi:acyl phosphate:glycerol-3-phosphate acyltransferase